MTGGGLTAETEAGEREMRTTDASARCWLPDPDAATDAGLIHSLVTTGVDAEDKPDWHDFVDARPRGRREAHTGRRRERR